MLYIYIYIYTYIYRYTYTYTLKLYTRVTQSVRKLRENQASEIVRCSNQLKTSEEPDWSQRTWLVCDQYPPPRWRNWRDKGNGIYTHIHAYISKTCEKASVDDFLWLL